MSNLSLRSPAKLNLYLKVLKKRKDGFHDIHTLFERIDLQDEIIFKPNKSGKVSVFCKHPDMPTNTKNIVFKAVRLLQQDLGIKKGVHIHIKKRIPVAAGLAGGSSNAATTLIGLNKLWRLNLNHRKLMSYARQLGSDVAFFITNYRWALGSGRGDKLKAVKIRPKLWHILVVMRIKLLSGKVYAGYKRRLTKTGYNANILIHYLNNTNIDAVSPLLTNDLEPAAEKLCPRLTDLKNRLKALGAKGVLVSGSGPSVFGIVDSKNKAMSMAQQLKKRYSQVFVVRTC